MTAEEPWGRLDELTDDELATLVAAARQVLVQHADGPDAAALLDAPPIVAGHAIAETLRDAGVGTPVDFMVDDEDSARVVSLAALRVIGGEPALAGLVAEAYRARRDMLAVDGGLITGIVLLALVLKLKRIKVGKVDITFFEARAGMLDQLRNLLGR